MSTMISLYHFIEYTRENQDAKLKKSNTSYATFQPPAIFLETIYNKDISRQLAVSGTTAGKECARASRV